MGKAKPIAVMCAADLTDAFAVVVERALQSSPDGTRFPLAARPGATKESLELTNAGLVLKVRAPANNGKANARIVEVMAELLGTAKSRVSIKSGHTSRHKTLLVRELTPQMVSAKLRAHLS